MEVLSKGHQWQAPLERVVESPFFVDSKRNQVVQLADFCAYDFYAALRRHPRPFSPFWRHEKRLMVAKRVPLITSYRIFPTDFILNRPQAQRAAP